MEIKKTSVIWKRTIYYFIIVLGLFFCSTIYFTLEISQSKSEKNVIKRTVLQDSQDINSLLTQIESTLKPSKQTKDALNAIADLKKKNNNIKKVVIDLQTIEKQKLTSENSEVNTSVIEKNYAILKDSFHHNEFIDELKNTHVKFIIVFTLFTLGICMIMLVLIRMLLLPLEKIIQSAQKVAKGDLKASFKINSDDELNDLANVLTDLTTNTSELLYLISNTHASGHTQIELLERAIEAESHDERDESIKEIRKLYSRLKEVTEYFEYKKL